MKHAHTERSCTLEQQRVEAPAIDEKCQLLGLPFHEIPVPLRAYGVHAPEAGALDIDVPSIISRSGRTPGLSDSPRRLRGNATRSMRQTS